MDGESGLMIAIVAFVALVVGGSAHCHGRRVGFEEGMYEGERWCETKVELKAALPREREKPVVIHADLEQRRVCAVYADGHEVCRRDKR